MRPEPAVLKSLEHMKKIDSSLLVCMDTLANQMPFRIELSYAKPDNLLFGERIYRAGAQLWLHKVLAEVVLKAAADCYKTYGCRFILYDGLRTTDAQAKMLETQRVKDNPHWLEEPRLLSPPGKGGHPRGMAIDIALEYEDGSLLDMGTPFDYLAADPSPAGNPAHRQFLRLTEEVHKNRKMLTDVMMKAAGSLGTPLLPLPQEWWDYRLPAEIYEQYEPLSDADLPRQMRMV